MAPKGYLWTMRIIALASLGGLSYVVMLIDPESGYLAKVYFFMALFLFSGSFFNLLLLWIRRKGLHGDFLGYNLAVSLRQALLLAVLTIALLALQGLRMLVWWDGLLLVAGIFLIELYFLSSGERERI